MSDEDPLELTEEAKAFAEAHGEDHEDMKLAEPWRSQFNFTFAVPPEGEQEALEIIELIRECGEEHGFFFEFGFSQEMDMDDVIPGSPLHQAITGREPRE